MRLVFVLYAEDRDLMPQDPVYEQNYGLRGLFERLATTPPSTATSWTAATAPGRGCSRSSA